MVDARVNKTDKAAIFSEDADRTVAGTDDLTSQISDALEEGLEIDLRGEDHARLNERGQPSLGRALMRGHVHRFAHAPR